MHSQQRSNGRFIGWTTVGLLLTSLSLAGSAFGESTSSPGAALRACGPMVVMQLPAGGEIERQRSTSAGTLPLPYGEGARLLLIRQGGTTQVLSAGFHSAADPALSFDGKRILFAGKRKASDSWSIFEMDRNGNAIRQIVRGKSDCRQPVYLSTLYTIVSPQPWYQIAFVGSESRQLNEYGTGRATHLFSCKLDGSELRRLSDNMSSDLAPWLMEDGRLLFSSWQRCTLEHGVTGRVRLAAINIDGTDLAAFAGEGGRRIRQMVCTTSAGLAVFVEADRVPWDGSGQLGAVSLRRPLHSYRALTEKAGGLFHSPSPLQNGHVLVSHRPADGSGTLGLWEFDPVTRKKTLVFDDPAYHEMHARQLRRRPEPDGRSSVVKRSDPQATFYCLDIHQSDLDHRGWLPAGAGRRLRVIAGTPRRPGAELAGDTDPRASELVTIPQMAQRRILGEIEIASDGSFQVEVPANTPIQLQVVDTDGMSLRSCGWIWAKNHEPRGCIGCHEDGELTPTNWLVEALALPAPNVCGVAERHEAIDFRRDIVPIVAKRCANCHASGRAAPYLADSNATRKKISNDADARKIYQILLAPDPAAGDSRPVGKYVDPGRARTSPLVWHLFGRNTSRPWDGSRADQPVKPIPPDASSLLSAAERATLVEWIDLGARWDSGPP